MFDIARNKGQKLKNNLADLSCSNLINFINIIPKLGGFPLMSKKTFVPFWVVHFFLASYVYVAGVTAYQMYYSTGYITIISNTFSIIVLLLVYCNSFFFLIKRTEINDLLKLTLENDADIFEQGRFLGDYRKLMKKTKIIIFSYYIFQFFTIIVMFIPSRIFDMENFMIVSCVGLEPLNVSPNQQFCMIILTVQELTSGIVVVGYDVLFLFLFSHTTAVFIILFKDMEGFNEVVKKFDGSIETGKAVGERLRNLINRHAKVLLTIRKLQQLFGMAMGVIVTLNTVSVCAFFVLPLDVALSFGPVMYYTLAVFFLYCLQGQWLINASEKFEIEVYCCGWEKLPRKEQKLILMMLRQAQQPVMLVAMDMVPICMSTFADKMQAIYSFITVFKV